VNAQFAQILISQLAQNVIIDAVRVKRHGQLLELKLRQNADK
jgi:hypothetical protein